MAITVHGESTASLRGARAPGASSRGELFLWASIPEKMAADKSGEHARLGMAAIVSGQAARASGPWGSERSSGAHANPAGTRGPDRSRLVFTLVANGEARQAAQRAAPAGAAPAGPVPARQDAPGLPRDRLPGTPGAAAHVTRHTSRRPRRKDEGLPQPMLQQVFQPPFYATKMQYFHNLGHKNKDTTSMRPSCRGSLAAIPCSPYYTLTHPCTRRYLDHGPKRTLTRPAADQVLSFSTSPCNVA